MKDRIYRYVVRYDTGVAPNPFGGWCSLAICKPAIRRTAQVGDWIIGLRSQQAAQVLYVMQVEHCLSFADYWRDPRFLAKRPDRCPSSDNIYRPDASGELVQVPNRAHVPSDTQRDLSGQQVLVGRRFWYFGDRSPELPADLAHLVHASQGHSLHKNRRDTDVQTLVDWLSGWSNGIHGSPIDADRLHAAGVNTHLVDRSGCGVKPQHPFTAPGPAAGRMGC